MMFVIVALVSQDVEEKWWIADIDWKELEVGGVLQIFGNGSVSEGDYRVLEINQVGNIIPRSILFNPSGIPFGSILCLPKIVIERVGWATQCIRTRLYMKFTDCYLRKRLSVVVL